VTGNSFGNVVENGMDTRSNPKAIENARKQKGFSLQQLADAIGLSLEHARDIEMHDDECNHKLTP
jgi:ribosome-binding protein aMBF1 (putative translation factor)